MHVFQEDLLLLFCFPVYHGQLQSGNVLFSPPPPPQDVAIELPEDPQFKPRTVETLSPSSIITAASAQSEMECFFYFFSFFF